MLDCVVIGQGLAGSTLAWQLHWRGKRILIVDRDDAVTSSKVAGGLMTPVTGQRLVPSWRLDELWPAALTFYRRVESLTGSQFLHQQGQVRLFGSDLEVQRFAQRDLSDVSVAIRQSERLVDADIFNASRGGFEMPDAGRLDIATYLKATRDYFESSGACEPAEIDSGQDIQIETDGVALPRLGVRTRSLVFCQGFASRSNHWFKHIEFDATRGELLTVRVPGLQEKRIVGCGVWIAPLGHDLFRVGSTYDWNDLNAGPTSAGRDELCQRLREFLKLSFEVVEHAAAVRPIVKGRHPVMGMHPEHPELMIFNGLGSKGALQAPFLAAQLADVIGGSGVIDDSVDVQLRFGDSRRDAVASRKDRPLRLTDVAHDNVRRVATEGDIVVDATAGNGHDTCFLAGLVGSDGSVFSIDVQPAALERTSHRLQQQGQSNVTMVRQNHSQLSAIVPGHLHGRVAAVMFNLGYLPGGDKSIITTEDSTIPAILAAFDILRPGGVVTILVYPGHPGGSDESEAVANLLQSLEADRFKVNTQYSQNQMATSPRLHTITSRHSRSVI